MRLSAFLPSLLLAAFQRTASDCKCFPEEECWPTADEWEVLNQTVYGRLIATTPLGKVCHDPYYDAAECDRLKEAWLDPKIQ